MGNYLVTAFLDFLDWAVSQMTPYAGLPTEVTDSFMYLGAKVQSYLCVMPVDTILLILKLNLAIAFGYLMFRAGAWLMNRPVGK